MGSGLTEALGKYRLQLLVVGGVVIVGVCSLAAVVAVVGVWTGILSPVPSADQGASVAISGVLRAESFGEDPIAYPEDWPAHSRLPEEYQLVSTSSGTLGGDTRGWVTRFVYRGVTSDAVDRVTAHFGELGWGIGSTASTESGGCLAYMQGPESGAAIVVVEPDATRVETVLVSITVYK